MDELVKIFYAVYGHKKCCEAYRFALCTTTQGAV